MARRIAVIDDDGAVRDLLAEVLADEGYERLVFADGEAALPALRAHPPDALILDLQLAPPRDNWAILGRMRDEPGLRLLPVVVCSGDHDARCAHAAALDRPGSAVLAHPFDLDALLATLASAATYDARGHPG